MAKGLSKQDSQEIILIEAHDRSKHSANRKHDEKYDGERNLSINCKELRYFLYYLLIVGQWYPKEWSSVKKKLYHIWQLSVTIGVWIYFFYSFGCLGFITLERQSFKWFPISAIEDIVWEFRWVVSHHLGLFYFCRQRHLEKFLKESWLTQDLWKETSRYLVRLCIAVITCILLFPVLLRPAEILYSVDPQQMWKIILDTIVLTIDRLVSAPIFLVFVFVSYVLVRVVKGYGEGIKTWPKSYDGTEGSGMRKAKSHFQEIKYLIRSVGNAFQLYLALHFLLLLITSFLGVFACAEQIEVRKETNHSYYKLGYPRYYNRLDIAQYALTRPKVVNMTAIEARNQFRAISFKLDIASQRNNLAQTRLTGNLSATQNLNEDEALQTQVMIEVGIETILRILESIILYMVPLTLMLRLQTKLKLVRQAITDLDCFEQRDNNYLFQDDQTIETMTNFVDNSNSLQIFGYKVPLFRTFLLSVFAPFVGALTTFLFSYIHVKRK